MLTVTAQQLSDAPGPVQQSFLESRVPDKKRESLEKSMDAIRQKYGSAAIGAGSRLNNDLGLSGLCVNEKQGEEAGPPLKGRGPL